MVGVESHSIAREGGALISYRVAARRGLAVRGVLGLVRYCRSRVRGRYIDAKPR